jgi:hypothetical protein
MSRLPFHADGLDLPYHKRSNVESTFSAIKRKFGVSVMSRDDAAMVNEVLCKVLYHNLTRLIQEHKRLAFPRCSGTLRAKRDEPSILKMFRR